MYAYTAASWRAINSAAEAQAGEQVSEQIPASVIQEIAKQDAKIRRNELLRLTDWTQVGDAKITGTEKAAWQVYRQALRDLTNASGWPIVNWPTAPNLVSEADAVPRVVVG